MPEPTTNCVLSSIVTFLGGGFVGAFLNHFLSSARDRRAQKLAADTARAKRKTDFLSFLSGFRSEAERTKPSIFAELFPARVHRLREESAKLKPDLGEETLTRFNETVTALCRLTDSQVEEVQAGAYLGRDRVAEAIDAIARTLDSN